MNGLEDVKAGEKIVGLQCGIGMYPIETSLTVTSTTPKLLICKPENSMIDEYFKGDEYCTRISKKTAEEYGAPFPFNKSTYFASNHPRVIEVRAEKLEHYKFNTLKNGIENAIKNCGSREELLNELQLIVELELAHLKKRQ